MAVCPEMKDITPNYKIKPKMENLDKVKIRTAQVKKLYMDMSTVIHGYEHLIQK